MTKSSRLQLVCTQATPNSQRLTQDDSILNFIGISARYNRGHDFLVSILDIYGHGVRGKACSICFGLA